MKTIRKRKRCIILIPTYNDWVSLGKLLREINKNIKKLKREIEILIINDASTAEININKSNLNNIKKFL